MTTRRPTELCNAGGTACIASVTRFVWSGLGIPQFAGETSAAAAAEYAGRGVRVEVPGGMGSDEFDLQVIATAERLAKERDGKDYSLLGDLNSNRFV
ncbi:MAG TPA: hypothetical protein VE871_09920 [Longimicrobium sp.]|nr:hypothetical protein [Longimicrobium sp.]